MTLRARWGIALSAAVLFSQSFRLPSPVINVVTGLFEPGYQLQYPLLYKMFAPFFMLAESITVMGLRGCYVLLGTVIILFLTVAGIKRGLVGLFGFLLFVAWGAAVPKPMVRLIADSKETLLIDFHSHSKVSHDGRPSFTAEANRRWHRDQGYHAGFITDHNRTESSSEAKVASRVDWKSGGYSSLEGEEISLKKTHLVILGVHERIDNQPYDSDAAKIPVFIADMHRKGIPVIASLPEYWLHHWGAGVEDMIRWGIDGFEVVNSAPKALDFPGSMRNKVIDLCSTHNLFITGISDNHGYGFATAAWNAMHVPNWANLDPDQLEQEVLRTLKTQRFEAVKVLERPRFDASSPLRALLSPLASLWILWRSLTPVLALSWIAWIWGFIFIYSQTTKDVRRRGPRA